MIKWETSKNVTTGLATGLGGIAILPVSIPTGFGSAWFIQARLAAGVAHVHGHDLHGDRVRTLILMSLLGDAGIKEPIKVAGTFAQKALQSSVDAISRETLKKINQAIGFRLLTKLVPAIGGLVGGIIDGVACYAVGAVAQSTFSRPTEGNQAPSDQPT